MQKLRAGMNRTDHQTRKRSSVHAAQQNTRGIMPRVSATPPTLP